jgi:hypothetical protein
MRKTVLVAATILSCATAGWGQFYYEASGQTAVFTLAAGAKSGPVTIPGGVVKHTRINSGISVIATRGGIVITLPALQHGKADIALYNLSGRQIYRQRGYIGTSLRLDIRRFAPGIYTVFVCIDGKDFSRKIAVSGRGK